MVDRSHQEYETNAKSLLLSHVFIIRNIKSRAFQSSLGIGSVLSILANNECKKRNEIQQIHFT